MPAPKKLAAVEEIKARLNGAEGGVLLVDYRGLSVKAMAQLRNVLREVGGDMVVLKNSLVEIALRESALPAMDDLLAGPSAFVFVDGDPVASAKALAGFAKENKELELKGGLVQGQVIDGAGLNALSKLPSREELIAKLLGTLQNPARGLVTVMSGTARGLVTALDAVAKEKPAA